MNIERIAGCYGVWGMSISTTDKAIKHVSRLVYILLEKLKNMED
jgi:hypothetical protein